MYWQKSTHDRYMISFWHCLELMLVRETNGNHGTSITDIFVHFSVQKWTANTIVTRLISSQLIKQSNHNKKKVNTLFILTDKARVILKENGLNSFLDVNNPRIGNALKRARLKGKEFPMSI